MLRAVQVFVNCLGFAHHSLQDATCMHVVTSSEKKPSRQAAFARNTLKLFALGHVCQQAGCASHVVAVRIYVNSYVNILLGHS
jgi:hypothetical protein